MSTIESQDLKLGDVLKDFYAVPDYQREYVWTDDQVDQLLRDIRTEQSDEINSDYFIGSIVVCPGKNGRLDLIDGQQRLTTLFIALCALRDRYEALGEKTQHIRRLIAEDMVDEEGTERFEARLEPQYEDAGDVFTNLVKGIVPSKRAATRTMRNVAEAYFTAIEFFTSEFSADVSGLRAYYGYLINKVKIIRITTNSLARALKIFETINDRGVSLDAMDLLKNLLFIKTKASDFDKLKNKWKVLADKLYGAGEKPLRFLRYFIFATYPTVGKLQEDELYQWFIDHEAMVGYGKSPLKFVESLSEAADAYLHFLVGKGPDGNVHENVESLSLLAGKSIRQHLIILLAARTLPSEIFAAVCQDTEDLVFVYMITRQINREFEVYFQNWASEIAAIKTLDEYMRLSERTFAKRRGELATRFTREFPALDGRSIKQFQLRYVLAKLTQYMDLAAYGRRSAGHRWLSRYCDGSANHIEHILPQTPTLEVEAEFGPGAADLSLVWSIGNLALAESAINQSLGNMPFSYKSTVYPMSQLLLTRSISAQISIGKTSIDRALHSLQPFSCWNAEAVRNRAMMLASIAEKVWHLVPSADVRAGTSELAFDPQ
ncbi:DUF262 domain-containing protein [Bradyrhizobium sp.]|uniref:DUF262 domain-containing protein n=1 Tax=Bradyrhizobium sp. TaxID=376 RepID=UPI0029C07880|nr:DUF262 domain-containing protein [Bradyrhizobium sp.]